MNLLLLTIVAAAHCTLGSCMDGFDQLFSNSYDEFHLRPVAFVKPLPLELKGSMIQNGLGLFDFEARSFVHPFDGLAKLTKVDFLPGTRHANFSMKFLLTDVYLQSVQSSDIAPYLFFDGVEPPFGFRQRVLSLLYGFDNMNVNVVRLPSHGNASRHAFLALNDVTRSYRFDPASLDTQGRVNVEAFESVDASHNILDLSSAHPLPEWGTENYLTFEASIDPNRILHHPERLCSVSLVRMTSDTERQVLHTWELSQVPYMHSFAATRRLGLLFLHPLFIDLSEMLVMANPMRCFTWHPENPMRILWLDLTSGVTGEAAITDGHFLMHHINAYEEQDALTNSTVVIVDATAYPDLGILQGMTLSNLRDPIMRNQIPVNSILRRYRVSLDTGKVQVLAIPYTRLDDPIRSLEMPVINEAYRYRKYCFVYGILLKSDSRDFSKVSLVKKSFCDGADDRRWYLEQHYPSEPAFYPARHPTSEDDGYLVSLVMDGLRNVSYVGVFNAKDMTLVNLADLPSWVPYRLHGKPFV